MSVVETKEDETGHVENVPSYIDSQHDRETKDVAYVASKGSLGALEKLLSKHILFEGRDPDLMDSGDLIDRHDVLNLIIEEAAANGHLANLRYLADNIPDCDWNHRYNHRDNYTALMIARENDQEEIVNFLLDVGADIDIKNNDGKTVMDISVLTLDMMKKKRQNYRNKDIYQRSARAICRKFFKENNLLNRNEDFEDDQLWPWVQQRGPVDELIYEYAFDSIRTLSKEEILTNRRGSLS